ncbi:MAG: hypothetical protein QOC98_194 [Frankiaceae bacterium]|nr:hypothetical protein [Frankiaceae bacterium]
MLLRSRATDRRTNVVTRSAPPLLALLGSAALLVACGSSGGSTGASSGGSSAATAPQPLNSRSGSGTMVSATENEFKIALSQTSFKPGPYTFRVQNTGKFPHALTVDGPGVQNQATTTLTSGQTGSVSVTLQAGTYTLYCPVDGHRAKGMLMHITVAPDAAAAAPSSASSPASTSGGGGY